MLRIAHRGRTTIFAIALLVLPVAAISAQDPEAIVGDWRGTLNAAGTELPVIFHITLEDGRLAATFDSPSQGAIGIPIDIVSFSDGTLEMEMRAIGGGYEGTLGSDGSISGTWRQGGISLDLVLERGGAEPAAARPQDPTEPYPYEVEEVAFDSAAGVRLAGTLTRPSTPGPHAAVVLISGSGPQNRDEALMGHRPFLVLADHLTRNGIAVLRYDDRGVGESTGSFASATSADFADDATAAVGLLKQRSDIDAIGLAGHSEGGLIAPMVANRSSDVDFVVLLAGPGLTGEEILYLQSELLIKASGGAKAMADANRELQQRLFAILKSEPDVAAVEPKLRQVLRDGLSAVSSGDMLEAQIQAQLQPLLSPWFRYFLSYDPQPALRELRCPVLALNGSKDLQVPARQNLDAIRNALEAGGNEDFEVIELAGLNHLFQTADTGLVTEYASIEETFSPQALSTISDWILQRVR